MQLLRPRTLGRAQAGPWSELVLALVGGVRWPLRGEAVSGSGGAARGEPPKGVNRINRLPVAIARWSVCPGEDATAYCCTLPLAASQASPFGCGAMIVSSSMSAPAAVRLRW